MTYLGHATVLLELDGVRLLTDPLLGARLGPLRRHGPTPDPVAIGAVDAVLLSHAHPDHLDPGSIARLAGDGQLVVPAGVGRLVGHLGRGVQEVSAGDRVEVGGLRITAVPALHWRWPLAPRARPIGFLVEGTLGVYFAGDTRYFSSMASLAGRVDLALLPVGRWGPHPGPDRLGPASAARAAQVVAASVAIPIHWGTFYPPGFGRLWPRPLREPAAAFAAELATTAPEIEARVLEPGETTRFAPGSRRR